jgi:molybdate transport system substrate-binding protein
MHREIARAVQSTWWRGVALLITLAWLGATLGHGAEVKVFAAASLTDAMQEIGKDYAAQSTDKIIFNFEGSNVLARQIRQGAPADLFFSADEAQMDAVSKAGLLTDGSRQNLLSNSLVIVVPADSSRTSLSPKDLAGADIKHIALADPQTVPAGVYSKAYLEKLGLWDAVQPKVIPTQNVRAALAAVGSDNADAGIVYKTDAQISKKVKVVDEIPAAEGPKISYPVALIKGSSQADAAQKFLTYLESPAAGAVFAKYGFIAEGR